MGYGEVVSEAVPVSEFEVDGERLLSLTLKNPGLGHDADDPLLREWLVGIRWERTFSIEEAKTFKGVFANQTITCKLRHPETVKFVEREFGVEEPPRAAVIRDERTESGSR